MDMEPWVPLDPGLYPRMFVGPVVIDDQVQIHFRRSLRINRFEESDKLLVPMPGHAITNHSSIKRYHRSKQRRRAVPFVIVRHGAATPFLQRQPRLRPVESLNLRFLVNAQHERLIWRVQIQSDHIIELFHKLSIATQFGRLDQMRFELMLFPDSPDRSFTDSRSVSHQSGAPVSCVWRLPVQCHLDNSPDLSIGNSWKLPGRGASFSSPARRSPKKRCRQSCTVGRETPSSFAIS